MRRRAPLRAAIVVALVMLSAACGASGGSAGGAGSTPTMASPAPVLTFCRHVDGLRGTLESLSPVKGSLTPSATMKAAARDIQSSLAGLAGRHEWRTQIDNLDAATANMESAADRLAETPGARGVTSDARVAVARVNDAIRRLLTAVGSRCPAPSPAPSR